MIEFESSRGKTMMAAVVLGIVAVTAGAETSNMVARATPAETNGPLAGLPSQPGPTIEKIKALGDNAWINLGAPAADPKWGKAFGRSWGGKAFAPANEFRGAFFTGEGMHGFVKPDGYGMDDYWFYDINAHRWICLYPGTDTKNFNRMVADKELTVNDLGFVVDRDGQPIPAHLLIHAWGYLAYDDDLKTLAFPASGGFGRYYMPGEKRIDEGLKALDEQRKGRAGKRPVWLYNAMTGKFGISIPKGTVPGFQSFGQFLYIGSKKQFFHGSDRGVDFFDPAKGEWTTEKDQGPRPVGIDFGGCYDSKRNRVYVRMAGDSWHSYDLKTSTWTKHTVKDITLPGTGSNAAGLHYDSVNDKVLIIHYATRTIWVYDPEADTWAAPIPFPAEVRGQGNCFYDSTLGVHFVYMASDSTDNGTMWVYRYKTGTGERTK